MLAIILDFNERFKMQHWVSKGNELHYKQSFILSSPTVTLFQNVQEHSQSIIYIFWEPLNITLLTNLESINHFTKLLKKGLISLSISKNYARYTKETY
jgi:hypothetical protein